MAIKQIEKELQDDKKKIEKYHATLKEKEARYQRMVSLVSRKMMLLKKNLLLTRKTKILHVSLMLR